MDKWEYKIISVACSVDLYDEYENDCVNLNKLGLQGWEVCSIYKDFYILLKRKIE